MSSVSTTEESLSIGSLTKFESNDNNERLEHSPKRNPRKSILKHTDQENGLFTHNLNERKKRTVHKVSFSPILTEINPKDNNIDELKFGSEKNRECCNMF